MTDSRLRVVGGTGHKPNASPPQKAFGGRGLTDIDPIEYHARMTAAGHILRRILIVGAVVGVGVISTATVLGVRACGSEKLATKIDVPIAQESPTVNLPTPTYPWVQPLTDFFKEQSKQVGPTGQ